MKTYHCGACVFWWAAITCCWAWCLVALVWLAWRGSAQEGVMNCQELGRMRLGRLTHFSNTVGVPGEYSLIFPGC